MGPPPNVNGISPREGPPGTKITIRGENLGTGGSYNDVDVEGYSVALGYAFDTGANGLSVRLEVEGAQYDDVEATNNADTNTKVKVTDLMSGSASISLVKSF